MNINPGASPWRLFRIGLLAWLAVIGFDFFLHAGILAGLYETPAPFLLSAQASFERIPLGYLSFAILVAGLVWLADRLRVNGWRKGLVCGLVFGAVTWGAFILGLYSISTAPTPLLWGWFLGQTVELGIAGVVVGMGLHTQRLRPLAIAVVVSFAVLLALGVALQNIGNTG